MLRNSRQVAKGVEQTSRERELSRQPVEDPFISAKHDCQLYVAVLLTQLRGPLPTTYAGRSSGRCKTKVTDESCNSKT